MEKVIRNKAWREAEREYALADADAREADRRKSVAKAKLMKLMSDAGLEPELGSSVYAEGDVLRVCLTLRNGRVSFDKEALFRDHPKINRAKYESEGTPSLAFKADVLPGAVLDAVESEEAAA